MSIFRCLTVLARPLALLNFSLTITFHIYSLKVNNCCFSDGCVIWRCFSVFLLFVRNLKKIMIDEIHYFHHFPSFPIPHHIGWKRVCTMYNFASFPFLLKNDWYHFFLPCKCSMPFSKKSKMVQMFKESYLETRNFYFLLP